MYIVKFLSVLLLMSFSSLMGLYWLTLVFYCVYVFDLFKPLFDNPALFLIVGRQALIENIAYVPNGYILLEEVDAQIEMLIEMNNIIKGTNDAKN